MRYRAHRPQDALAVENLFRSVFSESEGPAEGDRIAQLVKELIAHTPEKDLYGFLALEEEGVAGAIFFSRMHFETDIAAFILSPVAVQSDYQGCGVGKGLIPFGLQKLKAEGVEIVITYGDPSFYSKVGFTPLSEDVIRPPFELSQPEGWLGQSLVGHTIDPVPGSCTCVEALNKPVYW